MFCRILLTSLFCLSGALNLRASEVGINPSPVAMITNPCPDYSLINSVDFHPNKNLFCVTYTQGNRVVLYKIDAKGEPKLVQSLVNPGSELSDPQHAVFSPDGTRIVVANWTSQTLTIYQREKKGLYCTTPVTVIPSPDILKPHRPHGVAFSPCGNFLAIAYGASYSYGQALALYHMTNNGIGCELVSALRGSQLPGIPKGVTFSPDGTCLVVTFSDMNSLVVYGLSNNGQAIVESPLQIIQGSETQISRPEDVKISPDGRHCAVSNSDQHTVTFYPFDKKSNSITQSSPSYILRNPEAQLCFPHGIAFSPDGCFVVITQFGPLHTTSDGGIWWDHTVQPGQAKVGVYRIRATNPLTH